ncbi:response regulator [Thermodesulforhabdus norvegica]|uniref:Response regulator receiver domain-containing protein n=1 Tax=Thermodesulforhabdus norvegica TaxID=39841 RepID=A0A1I4UUV1_9BACT|nr:response regulator [Thermodesulforhabdus norvegica]SFM92678.1 Response regulator receiver domain-containing protein [Thermodesulforhabdus norvegica]
MSGDTGVLGGKSMKILVVEDSKTQAVHLKSLLERNGYYVVCAENGKAAWEVLQRDPPDIVITDILMPEMDGYELCRKIKADEKTRRIPVVLVSRLSDPEDIIKGIESGADNFITKPYDEEALVARIDYISVNKKLRRENRSEMGLEVFFGGKRHFITADRIQILDLLLSTYEEARRRAVELEKAHKELQEAYRKIKTLEGILPICSGCKKLRDDDGIWHSLEEYLEARSNTRFSHGLCPECAERLYPDYFGKK